MYDMLPFPQLRGRTPEEQMGEMQSFLIQFKETLEFILTNIGIDNLSDELITKLNTMGADIEKSNENVNEQMQQVVSAKTLTVSDVVNSDAFKTALESAYEFTVNFDTGNLEYIRK